MSSTVNAGWLKDNNGDKFAPKTIASQVVTNDGISIETVINDKAPLSHGNHVPTTETANNAKFLRNDNTWQTVTPSNIGAVSQSTFDSHDSNTTKHITSTERTNWGTAYTHSQSTHAPTNAQANVIESIKVNGTTQTISSKSVNITVPTKASDIGAAESSHGTHVSYSSTAPVMDGTASVGSASTVARSDHKHPTDTSRASKTEFDTHDSNTTKHITSTERTNWGAAYTHSTSAHAPSNAQANQNAFSNIAVSGQTTVAADTTTDTVTFAGSNVSITTNANTDTVTFSVADGSTSAKGLLQLTNSTSSTSTTTAATPSSVKSAYDLANTASTNASSAQTRADAAYTLAEGKVDSLSDLGITATATELNYVDGVTSAIQTQLNAKVPTSRTVNGKALSSNITLSASDVSAYSKTEIDNMVFITVDDIDTICGTNIQMASEVMF